MFDLLGKLFEVVATSPEKQVRDYYSAGYPGRVMLNSKLVKSIWAGEESWFKFWLLTNGDIIPVTHSHLATALDADLNHRELIEDGALACSITPVELTVTGSRSKKITHKQIIKIKNLYVEYKFDKLYVDGKKFYSGNIKSSQELTYYLEYGKEKWESKKKLEAVVTTNPEKQMSTFYKSQLNTKLTVSTWPTEKYLKFWMLTNGDIVPVESTHEQTLNDAGVDDYYDLFNTGALTGSIAGKELSVAGNEKITPKQIASLRNLCIEHDVDTLVDYVGGHNYSVPVRSSKEVAYYLEYGKEKWEAKNDVVGTKVSPEVAMKKKYKNILNTKLIKSRHEQNYFRFWLLTNGDVVPVDYVHAKTAKDAGTVLSELRAEGAVIASISNKFLAASGAGKKFTTKQISKLRDIYVEYGINQLDVHIDNGWFRVKPKSPKEAAYYLEYGKEKWESKNNVNLQEASATDVRRKHRSIKRLFPDFDAKTQGVEDMGGLRFVEQDPETWKFKIHSGTQKDVWYDAYLHFKNVESTLERMVKDRRFWVADKTKVDLRKLAKEFMRKVDIQLLCSCPADLYYGGQYIRSLDKYDAKYMDKEHRPPSVRNPKKYGAVCKHLDRLLKVLPFYSSTLAKWITDFYREEITAWEKESQEEFWGGVKQAHAAMQKAREEAPEEAPEEEVPKQPVVEPEKEPADEGEPVTQELEKEIAKREEEVPEEEKPEKEEPGEPEETEEVPEEPKEEEEEEDVAGKSKGRPKKKPKKSTPKIAPGAVKEPDKPQWSGGAGEGPEEDYF